MKILFDFDGVLTNQTEEALRVREIFLAAVAQISRMPQPQIAGLFQQAEAAMTERPERHGWTMRNRITAFADEDLFIRNNGLAACLDQWAYEGRAVARDLLTPLRAAGFGSFHAIAQFAYTEMVKETHAGKLKPIDPKSAVLMARLVELGHTAVIVSNSGTSRILDLFKEAGIASVAHSEDPHAPIRVRGDARKFELGENARLFSVGAYAVDTSRPPYEAILREERPNAVIGDVFSLDLSLPLHLTRTEPVSFGGMHLFLRTQHYTPAWSKQFCSDAKEANAHLHLIDDLDQMIRFLENAPARPANA